MFEGGVRDFVTIRYKGEEAVDSRVCLFERGHLSSAGRLAKQSMST